MPAPYQRGYGRGMTAPGLALFDFDGTITTADTMFRFVKHVVGPVRFALGLLWLGPMLVLYKVGVIPNHRAKGILLRHFLGGRTRGELEAAAATFADEVDGIVRPGARERLAWHAEQGHHVQLVSASLDLWVGPWAARHGLPLLATPAGWDGERFTGLGGTNCHGAEKVRRIDAALDRGGFERVWAYGDSSGDTEMLAIADEPAFKPFR